MMRFAPSSFLRFVSPRSMWADVKPEKPGGAGDDEVRALQLFEIRQPAFDVGEVFRDDGIGEIRRSVLQLHFCSELLIDFAHVWTAKSWRTGGQFRCGSRVFFLL